MYFVPCTFLQTPNSPKRWNITLSACIPANHDVNAKHNLNRGSNSPWSNHDGVSGRKEFRARIEFPPYLTVWTAREKRSRKVEKSLAELCIRIDVHILVLVLVLVSISVCVKMYSLYFVT